MRKPSLMNLALLCALCSGAVAADIAEGKPVTNRLAEEKSPYLRQHATNPVDWYAWGDAAFKAAREQNKPIFLSVGYSTCHWCHVMGRESFANQAIAAIMNEHFINIKVDREERPDVDRVYMNYVQAATGRGGWPMSVFMTPDLKPFYGGTYFPPEDRFGTPGFPRVLQTIAKNWSDDAAAITAQAEKVMDVLRTELDAQNGDGAEISLQSLQTAYQQAAQQYDQDYAGIGGAPKFPRPAGLEMLAAHVVNPSASPTESANAQRMLLETLRAMANGGMYDHIGGGFHRYSVDKYWHVPHYEKMLYDQGQLVESYLDAFQLTGDEFYAQVARDILRYVSRELSHEQGGFHAAEDADSLRPGAAHKMEGAFYVWENDEIDVELGEDSRLFSAAFGLLPDGNSPEGSDPHGELRGYNTLIRRATNAELAQDFQLSEELVTQKIKAAKTTLFALREQRSHPHRDDKILTAWNGLMIGGYARAGAILQDPAYTQRAEAALTFITHHLWDEKRQVLRRSWLNGPAEVDGVAVDYAYTVQAFLDVYEATFNADYLQWAQRIQARMDALFWDEELGAWWDTTGTDESILLRLKEDYDGAEPSASSIGVRNQWRLAAMLGDEALRERAIRAASALGDPLRDRPLALASLAASLPALTASPSTVVIVGDPAAADTQALLKIVRRQFLPFTSVVVLSGAANEQWLTADSIHLQAMTQINDSATAYYCEGFICQAPTTEPAVLQTQLK